MKYVVAQEIKSETKVNKWIYLFDLFFVIIYSTVSLILGGAVHARLRIPFYLYSIICALFLTAKSRTNRHRRNYEAMILFLRRDREVYLPVVNLSKRIRKGEDAA